MNQSILLSNASNRPNYKAALLFLLTCFLPVASLGAQTDADSLVTDMNTLIAQERFQEAYLLGQSGLLDYE
ncbi:hypothetical protein OAP18_03450, partial [Gammaproteobacteria bacterium]|nr:hypothetical protein [Gammaproteobacteria bacterium]